MPTEEPKQSPQPGKAVATKGSMLERLLGVAQTPAERERAFQIAEHYQKQALILELVAEVKARSWGNKVSPVLRAGIVRWALDIGADPVHEVDILGGGPYLNAKYWMRLCAAEPDFLKADETWVHEDPRASAEQNDERRELRIKYAIPDEIDGNLGLSRDDKKKDPKPVRVKAAVIVTGYFRDRGPFIGKKWSPSRANDDVGLDFPEASALTRAWRKMALQAVKAQPTITAKLKTLIAAEVGHASTAIIETAPTVPEAPAVTTGPDPAATVPEMPPVGVIEVHIPSKICPREGEHPRSECGYHKVQP